MFIQVSDPTAWIRFQHCIHKIYSKDDHAIAVTKYFAKIANNFFFFLIDRL